MATNPIVNTLPEYVEQNAEQLLAKSVLGAKTLDYIGVQTGVKTKATINLLNTDVEFQDGSACGFEAKGSQEITQRTIDTGMIKVNMSFCEKNLLGKYAERLVKIGANAEELPFEQFLVDEVLKSISANMDKAVWQGDKSSDDENLNKFDGLLKIMSADSKVIKVSATGTTYEKIKAVYMAIPEEVVDNSAIFVGADTYRSYIADLVSANLYHYNPENGDNEYLLPGSNVKVIKVNGLNGTGKIVAGRPDHFIYGTDLESNAETFDFWYSKDDRLFKLVVEWNAGVNYAFSDEVVLG